MKNQKTRQPDPVSGTIAHEGVNKPMNNTMGTDPEGSSRLDTDKLTNAEDSVTEALTDTDKLDIDDLIDDYDDSSLADDSDVIKQGLTPSHRQNIDESRIDEVLVHDALDDKNYPTIEDIADKDAVAHSHNDDL